MEPTCALRFGAQFAGAASFQRGRCRSIVATLSRHFSQIRFGHRSSARPAGDGRRLPFDRLNLSRSDDQIRWSTFCRQSIFVSRNAGTGATSQLEKFWAVEISVRSSGDLVAKTISELGMKIVTTVAEAQNQPDAKKGVLVPT